MWTFLVGLLPFLTDIMNWWSGVAADQAAATNAEQAAETQHQNDGAQSVADKVSADAQNAELNTIASQLDNPVPAAPIQPKA